MSPTPRRRPRKNSKPQPATPDPAPPAPRKNTKVTGERSESDFQSAAIHRNFGVAKPWGDSRRYDFILDNGSALIRVQVKCTESIRARAYETRATYTTGKGRAVYTKKDIDFIAAHVVPLDIFYIIPVEVCTPAPMLRFYPHRQARRMRLEPYREAWHLLESPDHGCKIEIQASADETLYEDHVGTDALVRPPSKARQSLCGSDTPVRQLPLTKSIVIPSEGAAPRSGSAPQSRDLASLSAATVPVRLPKSAAPWPIPPLRILATRKGKQILPDPSPK